MIVLFRYSKPRHSRRRILIGGAGLHCLAMITMASVFACLAAMWDRADNFGEGLIACAIGVELGYFGAGLVCPLPDRRMLEIAIGTLAFAVCY